jgi:hypothetical protein
MLKRMIVSLMGLGLLLTACAGGAAETPVATQSAPAADRPTAAAPATAAVQASQAAATCTVVSLDPTPGPTEQSLFPAPSAADWTQGPDSAYVTLTEYSDFM